MRNLPYRRVAGLLKAALLAALIAAATATSSGAQTPPQPAAAEADVPTAPVTVDGAVLFRLRGTTSYPAEQRAQMVRQRISEAAADSGLNADAVHVVESPTVSRVLVGDRPLFALVDADAALEGAGRQELALIHAARVRQAILDYRAARSRGALTRAFWRTGLATVLLLTAVTLLLTFWRRLDAALRRRLESRIGAIGIQSFEVVRAEQIYSVLTR